MRTVEVKCDGCGGDLTDAGPMPTYRLALSAESVSNSGSIIYDVAVRPAIDRTYHFCDLDCLDLWRARENHRRDLLKAWWDAWKEEHGHKDASGWVASFPLPGRDEDNSRAEFEAAALAAFPMKKPGRQR